MLLKHTQPLAHLRAIFAPAPDQKVRAILASGLFDARYYRAQLAPERLATGDVAAALHFHATGWANLLDPSPDFCTAEYLLMNDDVAAAGIDPLLHYLEWGQREGRAIHPAPTFATPPLRRIAPHAPDDESWNRLASRLQRCDMPDVAIVVPVFKGVHETLRCLFSVLEAPVTTTFRLVVVDDHTPEPAIALRLDWLAARQMIDLVRTPANGGFVHACNLGMRRHPAADVVLLNADTEVFGNWLDRLHAARRRDPSLGTLTPFSNNAEICSYPYLCRDNPFELEIDDAALDRLIARANDGIVVDVPTGVGFCLCIARPCLDATGPLDADTFGLGYGEENDFCRRAADAGWRNVLAADVFVRHYGGRSFGAAKAARLTAGLAAVAQKHPTYLQTIAHFIATDPAAPLRARIDAARFKERIGARGAMLFVTHNRGGGTERHLQELAALLEAHDTPVLIARPDPVDGCKLVIVDPQIRCQPNGTAIDMREAPERLAAAMADLGITHVHVHHLVDYDSSITDYLRLVCRAASVPYDFTAHDYLAICPRITLTDESGAYCGEPSGDACHDCLRRCGSDFGTPPIWAWRERFGRFLRGARHIFAPSADVASRLGRYFPDIRLTIRPHARDGLRLQSSASTRQRRGARHVGLIGALAPHKGSALFRACAARAAERRLPLRFTLLGFTDRDHAFDGLSNTTITGAYLERQLPARLRALAPDILWYPALWPETYSYTLDAAFHAGIPPVAFDLGAPAERIRQAGFGQVVPRALMFAIDKLLDTLIELDVDACGAPPFDGGVVYDAPRKSYYGFEPAGAA